MEMEPQIHCIWLGINISWLHCFLKGGGGVGCSLSAVCSVGTKITAQLIQKKRKPPKIFHSIWLIFCLFYLSNSQVSFQQSFSPPVLFPNLTYTLPPTLLIHFFLSLSLAYSPLFLLVSISYKKKWFYPSASLNKLISLNTVCHLRVSTKLVFYEQEVCQIWRHCWSLLLASPIKLFRCPGSLLPVPYR